MVALYEAHGKALEDSLHALLAALQALLEDIEAALAVNPLTDGAIHDLTAAQMEAFAIHAKVCLCPALPLAPLGSPRALLFLWHPKTPLMPID